MSKIFKSLINRKNPNLIKQAFNTSPTEIPGHVRQISHLSDGIYQTPMQPKMEYSPQLSNLFIRKNKINLRSYLKINNKYIINKNKLEESHDRIQANNKLI